MQYVGIDISKKEHAVAIVDDRGGILRKATKFEDSAEGYQVLFSLLGPPDETLIAMEATGHYWKNLFARLSGERYKIALINPIRTSKFAEEEMQRTKTDALDALSIARFACQKRPAATPLPDGVRDELRELSRHRDRLVQELGDRTRQLHRLVDLGFPEFTRYIKELDSSRATAILKEYPTAEAFRSAKPGALASVKYGHRYTVGRKLAGELIGAAKVSVGAHHGYAYRLQVEHACEDIERIHQRLRHIQHELDQHLESDEVAKLLITIPGIGPTTVARILSEIGDPARFKSGDALAAYVGVVPGLRHSGKRTPARASISSLGHARLRKGLWMPLLTAVQKNPWLAAFYQGLRAKGKLPKVALVAALRKLLLAIYSVAKNRKPFVPRLPAKEAATTQIAC